MELTSIAKDLLGLQKQAISNYFDAITLFQDQTEIANRFYAKQLHISDKAQDYVDQWRTIFKDGRDEYRRLIIESITNMEDYCDALGSTKHIEKIFSTSKP